MLRNKLVPARIYIGLLEPGTTVVLQLRNMPTTLRITMSGFVFTATKAPGMIRTRRTTVAYKWTFLFNGRMGGMRCRSGARRTTGTR